MILNAIAKKLKHQSKDDFKGEREKPGGHAARFSFAF